MIYTPMTKKAMQIAYEAHHGQVDKAGLPYIFHPFHLAESMTDEDCTVVALLHDVAEDTDWTIEALAEEGFNKNVLIALKLLTHVPSASYMDYISRLSTCDIARRVKIADLRHNLDQSRIDHPDEKVKKRWKKYAQALRLLEAIDLH